jgi:hypothetical protein
MMQHKWLNRRSQRRNITWDKLNRVLALHPLVSPKIKFRLY